MQCRSSSRRISAGRGTLLMGLCLDRSFAAASASSTFLHRTTQLSQMYTPGPEMSFLTSAWDLPQKLHSVSWVGRAKGLTWAEVECAAPRLRDHGALLGQVGDILARDHDLVHQAECLRFLGRHEII